MRKFIFKIASLVIILTLALNFSGCSDKSASDVENNDEALPTIAEDDVDCDTGTGGWKYDQPSQGEGEVFVPEEGESQLYKGELKNKFKDYLNKKPGVSLGELQGEELTFESKVIRTGSYTTGKNYPSIGLYRNATDLQAIDTIDYGTKYDEEFFKTKALIVIELRETSGSVRNQVTKVVKNGDDITVGIKKIVPEIGTADMAEWAIFVEIDNAVINENTIVDFSFIQK